MVTQNGINLAVNIITTHFGGLVAKVCNCLLRRGSLTLHNLIRYTELSASQVKNCLLVLIQHNCVQGFSVPRSGAAGLMGRSDTLYMAIFDNIIHRARFAQFRAALADDPVFAGERKSQCVTLIEGLLQHGRLTFEQLFVRETSSKQGTAIARDELRADFNRLVRAQYVERCPKAEPVLSQDADDKPASSRRRGAKTVEETPTTLEEQVIIAAALLDAERFSEITDIGASSTVDVKVRDPYLDVSVGDKRKHETLEVDQDVQTAITENEVLWRANFEKFLYRLKKKVCTGIMRTRLGLNAAIVLEAMIESSQEEKVKDQNSVTAEMDNILSRVRTKKGDDSVTIDDLRDILQQLGCSPSMHESGVFYSVDLKGIIERSQNDEVEAIVLKKYGENACRVFKLLAKNVQPFETDNISDITFVDKKEVKIILNKLWKNDYLNMEKAVSYAAGQMQQFLWRVNKKALWELILNEMYIGALNINLKIADISQQYEDSSNGEEKVRIRRGQWILHGSVLKIYDAILLFQIV